MKTLALCIVILLTGLLINQPLFAHITEAEYFINSDPGTGNGHSIEINDTSKSADFSFNVSTSNLTSGLHILYVRARDDSGRWSCPEPRPFRVKSDTLRTKKTKNLNTLRFYLDSDSTGNSAFAYISQQALPVISQSVIFDTLPEHSGRYTLTSIPETENGVIGFPESRTFYIEDINDIKLTDLLHFRYAFNQPPFPGDAYVMNVDSPGFVVDERFEVPVDSLDPGFHTLYIRPVNSIGHWGKTEARHFYMSPSGKAEPITSMEYFINDDPGAGSGISISIDSSGQIREDTFSIKTDELSEGFHTLYVRAGNTSGEWGITEARPFYLSPSGQLSPVTDMEYYINEDPGYGNANQWPLTPSGTLVSDSVKIADTLLTPGFHMLYVRARNQEGQWGIMESRPFYVSNDRVVSPITKLEYFFNDDPGHNNAIPLYPQPSDTTDQDTSSMVPLEEGEHVLYIRGKNAAGEWGLTEARPFMIKSNDTLDRPVLVTPENQQQDVMLPVKFTWIYEGRTDKFRFQISPDPDFASPVHQAGSSDTVLQVDTLSPFQTYHWRVAAVRGQGKGPWSEHFQFNTLPEKPTSYSLGQNYPNPFSDYTRIDIKLPEDTQVRLIVYDATGKQVATPLNKRKVSGNYTIRINGAGYSPGMYLYRLKSPNYIATRKMVIAK